jgi:hypothetical protein
MEERKKKKGLLKFLDEDGSMVSTSLFSLFSRKKKKNPEKPKATVQVLDIYTHWCDGPCGKGIPGKRFHCSGT